MVERLLEETLKIDYPRELLQIQVLDDSTDETHPFTEALVERYAASRAIRFEYMHRTNRHGYQSRRSAGRPEDRHRRIRRGFRRRLHAAGRFPAATVHYFTDPKVGMVQTRWTT